MLFIYVFCEVATIGGCFSLFITWQGSFSNRREGNRVCFFIIYLISDNDEKCVLTGRLFHVLFVYFTL